MEVQRGPEVGPRCLRESVANRDARRSFVGCMSFATLFHCTVAAVLFLFASAPAAFAWGVGGHKVIALIAFDRMSEEARSKAITLLVKHPRFQQDFLVHMPPEIAQGN